ncbi:MAG TPA: PorP/SprF family type IX secretion system membrane protein [Bacteroidia bacterium]|jgi:type IX secretion system PorP/SprF family membrane protein|nr:PorP/SprF family type IX secretion system membrane protein [Bacteroidia bacterium]
MKNKLIAAALLSSLFYSYNTAKAQDTRVTQFYAVPLLVNPAIMGANDNLNVSLDYRNQWGSVNSGYSDYAFTGMYPIKLSSSQGKLDAGISFVGDKAGAFNKLNGMLAVDYNKEIAEDNNVCLALMGGFGQESINTGGLTFDDQYMAGAYNPAANANENLISTKESYADFGFGLTWYFNPSREKSKVNAFFGISAFNVNQPNLSMTGEASRLPVRTSYQAGIKLFTSKSIDIVPNAYISLQAGNVESAMGAYGNYIINDDFKATLGFWYRKGDAFAILAGFYYKGFTLGYSYDAVTSTVINLTPSVNANEITLTYHLGAGAVTTTNPSPFPQF